MNSVYSQVLGCSMWYRVSCKKQETFPPTDGRDEVEEKVTNRMRDHVKTVLDYASCYM